MVSPALQRCVGDVDDFLSSHWGRAPLLRVGGGKRDRFADLATLDDLDHMVSSLALRASSLRMVADGETLPVTAYTTESTAPRAREALVDPAKVYERFYEGATIVLEGLHRFWAPVTDFCRDLEVALGHRLQVNAYITPPGSQGFDVHRDDHDVFVLQVSGSKSWVVLDDVDEERVLLDRVIDKGDVLYIPTGFPHAARSTESVSAHLTVGILTHDRRTIVKEVMKLADAEEAFKERLAMNALRDEDSLRDAVQAQIDELKVWLDKLDADDVTRRVARRVFSTAQPLLRGQLRQLERVDAIDESTRIRRRRGAPFAILEGPMHVRLLLADRELELPGWIRPALETIAESSEFVIRDLHETLDPVSATVLVKRLVREGALEVVLDG